MAALLRRRLATVWARIALGIGALLLLIFVWAWSGIYSVAASRGHWPVVEWFLAFVMTNSVETHALFVEAPALDNPDLIQLGAGHFHGRCADCHGAPGVRRGAIAQAMLPPPPDLSLPAAQWKDRELFWIVKHGIKYTGMPAWPSQQRDDEVWAVTAFLRQLPRLNARDYHSLVLGNIAPSAQSGSDIAASGVNQESDDACARCHGNAQRGPGSSLIPVLHGQPVEFLVEALQAYAGGKRQSGIMQPIAQELDPAAMVRVAAFYAGLKPPFAGTPTIENASMERGQLLALQGAPDDQIPPCSTCHAGAALAQFPRLAGQSGDYLVSQLQLWKRGVFPDTESGALMAPIAARLTEQQIRDVSAYFAAQPPGARGAR